MERFICTLMAIALCLAGPCFGAGKAGDEQGVGEPVGSTNQGLVQVGEELPWRTESPVFSPLVELTTEELVWQEKISSPAASYIAPHFSYCNLPAGARLVVRAPDGSRSWEYTGTGKGDLGVKDGFWGIHISGEEAIVEVFSQVPLSAGAVIIDSYARGFSNKQAAPVSESKAICGADDSEWAPCYEDSMPEAYWTSRPVARLLINGTGACTGWLVGSSGHLITNWHCIGNAATAMNTDYELMAEGATCATNCTGWFACPGTIVANAATLIRTNSPLDYTLVELPVNPTLTYGFLQMRDRETAIGERIYIPQHPQAWGKRIALYSDQPSDSSGYCQVFSVTRPACIGGGPDDVGYYCDTQGGSSGSPVLSLCDNAVIALHHCANCPNRGVPITAIIADLGADLPPNSVSTSSWTCDDCGPGFCVDGSFCDKLGCYEPDSTISRAFCLCDLLDPRSGLGSCIGINYCTGANYLGLCYIDTAPQSQVMCQEAQLDAHCHVIP